MIIPEVAPMLTCTRSGDGFQYELLLRAFHTIWLRAEPETHFRRVMAQRDARIARPALYREAMDNIHRSLTARQNLYEMADEIVDTTYLGVDEIVERIADTTSH